MVALRRFKEQSQAEFQRLQRSSQDTAQLRLERDRLESECSNLKKVWEELEKTRRGKESLGREVARLKLVDAERELLKHRVEELDEERRGLLARLDLAGRDKEQLEASCMSKLYDQRLHHLEPRMSQVENLRLKMLEGEVEDLRGFTADIEAQQPHP